MTGQDGDSVGTAMQNEAVIIGENEREPHRECGAPSAPTTGQPNLTERPCCAAAAAAGQFKCPDCKRYLPGNPGPVRTGLKCAGDAGWNVVPEVFAHLRAELAEFHIGAVTDEGGPDEVSTRKRALLEYRARLHRRIGQVDDALEAKGMLDRRGRLRTAWLQRLEGLINTAKALDSLLGLERRQKKVDPLDYIGGRDV